MAQIFMCDRDNKLYPSREGGAINYIPDPWDEARPSVELCPDCMAEFMDWLAEGKPAAIPAISRRTGEDHPPENEPA